MIVRIVDRGPGIPPAQLERVFEPFYRAGTPGGGHRGSGLGLAIARGFAEANAGSLHVESLPGQGATFVFELPLQEPCGEPADGLLARGRGRHRARASRSRPVTGRSRPRERARREPHRAALAPRVLVVDDEPQIVRALKVVLREAGFEAVPAETASRGARPRRGAPAGGGDRRPRAARRRRRRGDAQAARVERDADPRALGGGRGGAEGEGAGGRRRRLHHQALRRARAGRAAAGGAAPRRRAPRRSRASRSRAWRSTSPARVVRRDGEPIHLTPIEFDLLRVLVRNRGRLMTHRTLLAEVWGPGVRRRHPAAAHPHRPAAREDRAGASADGPRYIVTDPGVGYRFALSDGRRARPVAEPSSRNRYSRGANRHAAVMRRAR